MKVTKEEAKFPSITITLDTKEEADHMWAALNTNAAMRNQVGNGIPICYDLLQKMWQTFNYKHKNTYSIG